MPEAMIPIATTVVASAVSTVTIGVPSGYRDLQVVVSPKGSGGNGIMIMRYNNDSSTTCSNVYIYYNGSGRGGYANTDTYALCSISSIGTTFNPVLTVSVMDYSTTDKFKSSLIRYGNNDVSGTVGASSMWPSTAAITSITFGFTGTDNFAAGSTFELFGISA
jgi:hypothetical protein